MVKIIKYKKKENEHIFIEFCHLKIAISQNSFYLQRYFTPIFKPKKQDIDMDYDRTHQSHLESKYKAQKQNGTFLSFHPLIHEFWIVSEQFISFKKSTFHKETQSYGARQVWYKPLSIKWEMQWNLVWIHNWEQILYKILMNIINLLPQVSQSLPSLLDILTEKFSSDN